MLEDEAMQQLKFARLEEAILMQQILLFQHNQTPGEETGCFILGTKLTASVWFQVNQCMVNTI